MIHPDIFKDFGINVKKCYKFRGAYICETDTGTKAIRRSDYTPVQIVLQHNIKEHLIQNGFTCLDQLYVSKKNTPYVIYYNRTYVMTDWNNGQETDFCNVEDIKKSVQLLGQMHIAGEGFNNLASNTGTIRINNLGDTYEKRYIETIKLRKKIDNLGNKTEFEVLYFKNASIYKELQEMSKELTNPVDYKKLINIAKAKQTIAHRKYTYHNIIHMNIDNTIITGFERSGYDVQITDLAYVIRRIMQKNQWDINLLINIIDEYNKIKPLSSNEWNIIRGMIIFPEKFATLCNQYYHSKRRWNYNMFYRKFMDMLEYKDDHVRCAREIMKW